MPRAVMRASDVLPAFVRIFGRECLRVEPKWSWEPLFSNSRSREGGWLRGQHSGCSQEELDPWGSWTFLSASYEEYPQNYIYPNHQHPLCLKICWDLEKQVNLEGCRSFLTLMHKIILERWNFSRSIVKFLILSHSLMSVWSLKVTPERLPW